MKLLLVTFGLVFLSAQVLGFRLGCSAPCGPKCAPSSHCGCLSGCGLENEESMCTKSISGTCMPMVVRPQELPKPPTSATAALSLTPVPGPCLYKKVIVKPAVLPKPVCRPMSHSTVVDSCHSHSHSYNYNSASLIGTPDCHPVLSPALGGYGSSYAENQANCAPADAVSIALAFKMAKEQNCLDEDRLAFGFRKIPLEAPPRQITKNNIPEENIFALNGQIVELKPVPCGCRRSLEDEAADDLLALEAEDAEASDVGYHHGPLKRISLGEIGFRPAKLTTPTFEDITASTTIATDALDNYKCSCGSTKCTLIPGDIEYRTVPKPEQICLPQAPCPDSCESGEIEIDTEPEGCTCSCVPIVMKKCHQCHKKSSITIQKLMS